MPIIIQNHRRQLDNIQKDFPEATIIDVTSKGQEPWIKFSPFYPHGQIPVPNSPGYYSETVEGIWQGLKVFEKASVDLSKMQIKNMKGIKRSSRKNGKCLGHRLGIKGEKLLSYLEARYQIYLPTYWWILENRLQDLVQSLEKMAKKQTVILLDYQTNGDINNLKKPLSHAQLIRLYLERNYPNQHHQYSPPLN